MRFLRYRPQKVWIFCDGSSGIGIQLIGVHTNTSHSCGAAAVARDEQGQLLDWSWKSLPPMTNNEAEYAGLILGLQLAKRLGAQETICVLDSEVVIGQMEGRFSVNSQTLRSWHWRACATARDLPGVNYRAIPREWNRLADGLATQAALPWEAVLRQVERR